jgi:catechol 2,3-dioxygenase-like lactoylglutathione lyase family enzyme
MIGYVTLGTNDIERARRFYEQLLAEIGARQLMQLPDGRGYTMYGRSGREPMIAVTRPADGNAASVGNGNMIALPMESREQVNGFHAKALELGGSDEGAPGRAGRKTWAFTAAISAIPTETSSAPTTSRAKAAELPPWFQGGARGGSVNGGRCVCACRPTPGPLPGSRGGVRAPRTACPLPSR